ncbi:MAG: hypothetical protein ACRDPK_07440 [Carbonactinosporaceae bacterium]
MDGAGEPELARDRRAAVAIERVRRLSTKFPGTRVAVRDVEGLGVAVIDEGGGG